MWEGSPSTLTPSPPPIRGANAGLDPLRFRVSRWVCCRESHMEFGTPETVPISDPVGWQAHPGRPLVFRFLFCVCPKRRSATPSARSPSGSPTRSTTTRAQTIPPIAGFRRAFAQLRRQRHGHRRHPLVTKTLYPLVQTLRERFWHSSPPHYGNRSYRHSISPSEPLPPGENSIRTIQKTSTTGETF